MAKRQHVEVDVQGSIKLGQFLEHTGVKAYLWPVASPAIHHAGDLSVVSSPQLPGNFPRRLKLTKQRVEVFSEAG